MATAFCVGLLIPVVVGASAGPDDRLDTAPLARALVTPVDDHTATHRELADPAYEVGESVAATAIATSARMSEESAAEPALAYVAEPEPEPETERTLNRSEEAPQVAESAITTTTAPQAVTTTTTAPQAVTTTTTAAPTTTTTTTAVAQPTGSVAGASFIAPSAPTVIPVYDTAWQLLINGTPAQADTYFATLADYGFSGAWTGVIHHSPATYLDNFNGGGQVGWYADGHVILSDEYIAHVRQILDAANRHGMKIGLVPAWQNTYLPGGQAGTPAISGSIHEGNSYAYGQQMVRAFGDHPAVSMWVFGGDATTNNTDANKAVWAQMATGMRDAGSQLQITYHTPPSGAGQLNYAGEWWLDFVAPQTGHQQHAGETQAELEAARNNYGLPVWSGESRYFNITFDWIRAEFRNPGAQQMREDAQAARNAGVAGFVYGDAGRWNWCRISGDTSPCDANNIGASFGEAERQVIDVFR